ncbi:alpha/beta fold hydrolase [Hymenobacter terricola]|uniref:alpha/beta fold hydrolase n=1 Tax=Hymenobacter terricola TaxID=2819236 RepID=UPI001B317EC1|nr:alpha/beta fold hydrolase [Hymenobacter terricola]
MNKTFVLVHGAWSGKYAWDAVRPVLEQAGHRVITFDLPGHGSDPTPLGQLTLDSYVRATLALIRAEEGGPVVLVGHSMAGMIISQVAEQAPAEIDKLVYVCAYLPHDGQSAFDFADADSLLPPNLLVSADQLSATIKPEAIVPIFAADCPAYIQELVVSRHRPEALAPFQANVTLTEPNFGRVPKYYIETLQDVGISTHLQRLMIQENGAVAQVFALDCGHSPFFARPTELATILKDL